MLSPEMAERRDVSMQDLISAMLSGKGLGSTGLFSGSSIQGLDPDTIGLQLLRLYGASIAPYVFGRAGRAQGFQDQSDRLAGQAARDAAYAAGSFTPAGVEAQGASFARQAMADAAMAGRQAASQLAASGYGKSVQDSARVDALNRARVGAMGARASADPAAATLQGAQFLGQAGAMMGGQAFGPLERALFQLGGTAPAPQTRPRGQSFLGSLLGIGSQIAPFFLRPSGGGGQAPLSSSWGTKNLPTRLF